MSLLIVPAACPEAVTAAVESGANAVCMVPRGLGEEHTQEKKNSKDAPEAPASFTVRSFRDSVVYCRMRGIKTYLTLENFPLDKDLPLMEKIIRLAGRCDMDGVVVSDLGVLRMVRSITPDMKVIAGLQMSIHNAFGVSFLKEQEFDGVFLAPEMTGEQISRLRKTVSGMQLIVTVHGRVCTSYGGRCHLTEMLHPESGTPYSCGRVCEMRHGYGSQATDYPLTLKERCLAGEMRELEKMGITDFFITDQEARPDYIAAVTQVYRDIIDKKTRGGEYLDLLGRISERGGVTQGCFGDLYDKSQFGHMTEVQGKAKEYLATALQDAKERPRATVPVKYAALIRKGAATIMAVQDEDGHMFKVSGAMPQREEISPLVPARVKTLLYKQDGSVYYCTEAKVQVDDGMMVPLEELLRMKQELIEKLNEERKRILPQREGEMPPVIPFTGEKGKLSFTISVTTAEQLTIDMLDMKPAVVYVPIKEAADNIIRLKSYIRSEDTELCVTLPAAVDDSELHELNNLIFIVRKAGVESVQVENVGQIALAKNAGFKTLRGGLGLAARNSMALRELKSFGLSSACAAFTMTLTDMEKLSKTIDTEMVAYGRVPLMLTRGCLIKNKSGMCCCESENHIVDDKANNYPLLKAFGCRNVMFSAEKIFLGGLGARLRRSGVWGARLNFTTENPRECLLVMQRYIKGGSYEPNAWGTGLYLADDEGKNSEKQGMLRRIFSRSR